MKAIRSSLLVLGAAALAAGLSAQVTFTAANYSAGYSQNFNTLAQSGSANVWTDNSTLAGWYATPLQDNNYYGTSNTGGGLTAANGTTATALYSFALSTGVNGADDRALGFIGGSSVATVHAGLRLVNGTGGEIYSFDLDFRGEQYRSGTNLSTITVAYQVFDAGLGSLTAASGWQSLDLTFSTLNTAGTQVAMDGNAPGNFATFDHSFLNLNLQDGQELWIRWTYNRVSSGTFASLAFDDVTISNISASVAPIPEPSTYALIAGSLGLLLVALRRFAMRRQ